MRTTGSETRGEPLRRMARAVGTSAVAMLTALAPTAAGGQSDPTPAPTRHVIIISVDGLRPDAVERFGLRTLGAMAAGGGHARDAMTVMPSHTLPSHTSMLTGVGPESHGITWNRFRPEEGWVPVPTIFELARGAGHHVAAFYAKAKFRQLDRPDSYDYRLAPRWRVDNWMATDVVPEAVQYLAHRRPNLLFVHIAEPDYAGHLAGWMGTVYGLASRRADAAVGVVLAAARDTFGPDGFTIIVTADHGGHGRAHGTGDPRDMRIPWIVYGRGVAPGPLPSGIRTMDTAATALWLLGVAPPARFEGRPVLDAFTEAFVEATRRATSVPESP
jgi:predicted AlkP superfamily pyrophosphatase or phosphodiesterase